MEPVMEHTLLWLYKGEPIRVKQDGSFIQYTSDKSYSRRVHPRTVKALLRRKWIYLGADRKYRISTKGAEVIWKRMSR